MKRFYGLLILLLALSACNMASTPGKAELISREGSTVPLVFVAATNKEDEVFVFWEEKEVTEQRETVEPEKAVPVFKSEVLTDELKAFINGNSWNEECPVALSDLHAVSVTYWSFEGTEEQGTIIVHRELARDVAEIFSELYEAKFPIAGIQLIEHFQNDDNLSMAANNSYCFCTRPIAGTSRYSYHSYGMAVDINPVQNPYLLGEQVLPEAGNGYLDRTNVRPGMVVEGDVCYNAFVSRGWSWGGYWASPDYQHFQKVVD